VELYVKVHVKILICVSNWVDAIKIKIWIVLMDLCRVFALISSISAWWIDDLFWRKYLFQYNSFYEFLKENFLWQYFCKIDCVHSF
jgi:hypothetical protein